MALTVGLGKTWFAPKQLLRNNVPKGPVHGKQNILVPILLLYPHACMIHRFTSCALKCCRKVCSADGIMHRAGAKLSCSNVQQGKKHPDLMRCTYPCITAHVHTLLVSCYLLHAMYAAFSQLQSYASNHTSRHKMHLASKAAQPFSPLPWMTQRQ